VRGTGVGAFVLMEVEADRLKRDSFCERGGGPHFADFVQKEV
jgi:hypothetical protein